MVVLNCVVKSRVAEDNISNFHFLIRLKTIAFILCQECILSMSAFPPMMFSAEKIREARDKPKLANVSNYSNAQGNQFKEYPMKSMELNPVKYNSMLMDSIWGIYNRYSPHNFKKNNVNIVTSVGGDLQQCAAVSPKSEVKKLENVWNAINMSHSQ